MLLCVNGPDQAADEVPARHLPRGGGDCCWKPICSGRTGEKKALHFSLSARSFRNSNAPKRYSSISDAVLISVNAAFGSCCQIARSSAAMVSHPNLNMYRPGSVTRPTCRHVTFLTAVAPDLCATLLVRISKASSCKANVASASFRLLSSSARASSRWSPVGVACGSLRAISMMVLDMPPAGLNRRGYPDDHFNQLQSTETGVAAFVLATDGARSATRSVTGNCSTVARCPSQSCVTSTWLPSGNSIASWWRCATSGSIAPKLPTRKFRVFVQIHRLSCLTFWANASAV